MPGTQHKRTAPSTSKDEASTPKRYCHKHECCETTDRLETRVVKLGKVLLSFWFTRVNYDVLDVPQSVAEIHSKKPCENLPEGTADRICKARERIERKVRTVEHHACRRRLLQLSSEIACIATLSDEGEKVTRKNGFSHSEWLLHNVVHTVSLHKLNQRHKQSGQETPYDGVALHAVQRSVKLLLGYRAYRKIQNSEGEDWMERIAALATKRGNSTVDMRSEVKKIRRVESNSDANKAVSRHSGAEPTRKRKTPAAGKPSKRCCSKCTKSKQDIGESSGEQAHDSSSEVEVTATATDSTEGEEREAENLVLISGSPDEDESTGSSAADNNDSSSEISESTSSHSSFADDAVDLTEERPKILSVPMEQENEIDNTANDTKETEDVTEINADDAEHVGVNEVSQVTLDHKEFPDASPVVVDDNQDMTMEGIEPTTEQSPLSASEDTNSTAAEDLAHQETPEEAMEEEKENDDMAGNTEERINGSEIDDNGCSQGEAFGPVAVVQTQCQSNEHISPDTSEAKELLNSSPVVVDHKQSSTEQTTSHPFSPASELAKSTNITNLPAEDTERKHQESPSESTGQEEKKDETKAEAEENGTFESVENQGASINNIRFGEISQRMKSTYI